MTRLPENNHRSLIHRPGPLPWTRTLHWFGEAGSSHSDRNGSCVLFGHISNRDALQKALDFKGNAAAMLFAAWRFWGMEMGHHLHGDWAFVIVDHQKDQLIAMREPMGIIPLYYRCKPHFGVSSSARALSGRYDYPDGVSNLALLRWAWFGYDDDNALFEDVRMLLPGTALIANADGIKTETWWSWNQVATNSAHIDHLAEEFRSLLVEIIKERLKDAGPLALTLSSGMDSTSVAAAAIQAGLDVQPFSFHFKTLTNCDESEGSRAVAAYLGLPEPIFVDCESHWLWRGAYASRAVGDTPFLSWDTMDHWILTKAAEQGCRTVITGHGGDGLFTGLGRSWSAVERLYQGKISGLKDLMLGTGGMGSGSLRRLWRHLLEPNLPRALVRRFRHLVPSVDPVPRWLTPSASQAKEALEFEEHPKHFREPHRQALWYVVVQTGFGIRRLAPWYQDLVDEAGLAVQHPLMDRRLALFFLSLNLSDIRHNNSNKGFLRYAMQPWLPTFILENKNKPLFSSFYHYGFSQERGNIFELIKQSPLADRGLVDRERLRETFEGYLSSDPNTAGAVFGSTLMVDLWLRNWMS